MKINLIKNGLYMENTLEVIDKIPSHSVHSIITDPPYNFDEETKRFLIGEFMRIAREWVIIFTPPENMWNPKPDQFYFWIKPSSTKNFSKHYGRFVEVVQIYSLINDPTWNVKTSHWSNFVNYSMDRVDNTFISPYRKPPALIDRLIINHTNQGQIILDPFAGSGLVVEEATRYGRVGYGIEQDQYLVDRFNSKLVKIGS